MSSKSKSSSSQKSQIQSGVDSRIDPYLQALAGQTNQAMMGIDRGPLQDRAVAGATPEQMAALLGAQTKLGGMQVAPGTFTNESVSSARGDMLHAGSNPYLQGQIDAAIRPITERLNRDILPGIDQGAMFQNAFGGDRVALARGQAVGDWAEASGDLSANMIGENYARERMLQADAANRYASQMAAELSPEMMGLQLGEMGRGFNQLDIDNEIMTRAINEQLAFSGLGPAAQILTPMGGIYGNQNSTSESTQTLKQSQNPLTSIVQGGLGVASMLAGMPGGLGGIGKMFGLGGAGAAASGGPMPNLAPTTFGQGMNASQMLSMMGGPWFQGKVA